MSREQRPWCVILKTRVLEIGTNTKETRVFGVSASTGAVDIYIDLNINNIDRFGR
jgi:hypothetical protein